MSLEPLEYLRHMLAEAEYLTSATAGLTREQCLSDATLKRATVRSIEIIGDAAKKVPAGMRRGVRGCAWSLLAWPSR